MNLRNQVQLMGNLGSDPKMFEFENAKKVNFSIATNDYYTKNGEKVTETTWHNCVAWNKTAEIIEKYLKKGDQAIVSGRVSSRSYEDKQGNKRYITEIIVSEIILGQKSKVA